jgi:hypothetical protein
MTGGSRVAVVPCPPGLLPRHRGLSDPWSDLRAASVAAVAWLVAERSDPVLVLCPATGPTGRGPAVADHLLREAGHRGVVEVVTVPGPPDTRHPDLGPHVVDGHPDVDGRSVLALADGSARRGEKAPGYLDERAFSFDASVGAALRAGDVAALRDLDLALGAALLAEGVPVLRLLGRCLGDVETAEVTYDDDPFGVQYWVARWQCSPLGCSPTGRA